MVRVMVCVLVLCWWAVSSLAEEPPPETVLTRVEAFYQELKSFYAEFNQEVYWRRGYEVQASGGRIWFKRPNRLRWEYRYPERMLIVSDGQKVYFYSEEDRQVIILSLEKAFSRMVIGLMTGRHRLKRDFVLLSGKPETNGEGYFLELKPREEKGQVSRIRLKVLPKTGEIKEIWYWDFLGNLTHLTFEKVQFNLKIEDKKFSFTPPKDAEIIKEDG